MGEANKLPFKPTFNSYVSVEARPERLTAEPGALPLREIDERLGVTRWLAEHLDDPRNPELITHPLNELLRTNILLKAQGWRDQDDADHLRDDPALRLAVSNRRGDAALKPCAGHDTYAALKVHRVGRKDDANKARASSRNGLSEGSMRQNSCT